MNSKSNKYGKGSNNYTILYLFLHKFVKKDAHL